MKTAIFALVICLFVVFTEAAKRCKSNDECNENECCVSRGVGIFLKGTCKPRAKEGQTCKKEDDTDFSGKRYSFFCPCQIGMNCEPEEVKEVPWGEIEINPRCVSGEVTSVVPTEAPEEQTEAPEDPEEKTEAPEKVSEEPDEK